MDKHLRQIHQNLRYGFTIVEILIVCAILAVLLSIALIAINPVRHFNAASDTRRKSDLSQLNQSLMQYYVDHTYFPADTGWTTISCTGPVPSPYMPFMSALPCDPDTGQKYVYQALDKFCQPCTGSQNTCVTFRLLTTLKNTEDKAIISAGCDPVTGCGINGPNGEIPNFGVSSGCTIVATPVPFTPTPIPSNTPTPTSIISPTPSYTPTVTPTPTITSTPTPTITPTSTPTIPITPIPGYTPDPAYDLQRVTDLLEITLALEKYRFIFGQYPTCGGSWQDAAGCLAIPLGSYLYQSIIPPDPQNGDPYIYLAYSTGQNGIFDGFCLAAHLGDPQARSSEIDCPIAAPLSIYEYRIKERGEIIYRPTPSGLTELEKDQWDAQRVSDINYFISKMEQYKTDLGHYPTCWPSEFTWASTGSGSFFCQGQLTSYATDFNFDPGGTYSYNIVQWDPDVNGYFQQYCFGSYTDKGANTNCSLGCPVQNFNAYYCYFVKNP